MTTNKRRGGEATAQRAECTLSDSVRCQSIGNLALALTYHRAHPPTHSDRTYCKKLAARFLIGPKTMEAAIKMMAGGTNAELKEIL